MADLKPIGSVLVIGERRFVVVGHRVVPNGDMMGPGYLVVPYPLGYVTPMSVSAVPASAVSGVAYEGYAGPEGDAYLAGFASVAQGAAAATPAEYEASARLLSDFAQKGGRDA